MSLPWARNATAAWQWQVPCKIRAKPSVAQEACCPATRLGPSVVAVEPASALPREQPMLGVHANASCDGREANGKAAHEFWL